VEKNVAKILRVKPLNNLENGPYDFIKNALDQLTKEFELWGHIDKGVFCYNERAFVGFFNNAIIRGSEKRYCSLQEYVVYNEEERSVGRADLLVFDKENHSLYLFEAKRPKAAYDAEDLINWINHHLIKTLNEVIEKQAKIYFDAEKGFFKNANKTYIGAIYFERIKNIKNIDSLNQSGIDPNIANIFYTVFYFEDKADEGLAVYGLIEECDTKTPK
jgi:hypothetical protein